MGLTKTDASVVDLQWQTDWVPFFGALGGMTVINSVIQYAKYNIIGNVLDFSLVASMETVGPASDTITFTLPNTQIFTLPLSNAVDSPGDISISEDNGVTWIGGSARLQNTLMEIGIFDSSNFAITTDILISCSSKYEIEPPS